MANIFLNKGGAGISISRQETIARLEPISRTLNQVNLYYQAAIDRLGHEEFAEQLDRFMRKSHQDVGKLSETVLSAGGVPYSATDLEPENFVLEGSDGEMMAALSEKEDTLQAMVRDESKVRHQIRTQAILLNVQTNSQERLNYLKETVRGLGQQV